MAQTIRQYEIRVIQLNGSETRGFGNGYSAMEAVEDAIANGSIALHSDTPVTVVAINLTTGTSFKFEMAQAI
jgi:hypothetical protein